MPSPSKDGEGGMDSTRSDSVPGSDVLGTTGVGNAWLGVLHIVHSCLHSKGMDLRMGLLVLPLSTLGQPEEDCLGVVECSDRRQRNCRVVLGLPTGPQGKCWWVVCCTQADTPGGSKI